MLSRTRISKAMDMSRIASAVSRPGIDPRMWVAIAYANEDSVISQEGHFVDTTLSDGSHLTCQVGADYVGPGFGIYVRIHKDDELTVIVPEGHPNSGGVVVERLYSPADPPPQLAIDNPDDVVMVIEKDRNLRISVQGSGNAVIATESGDVMLGADGLTTTGAATDGVVTGVGIDPFTGQTYTALQNASSVVFAKKGGG